MAFVFKPVVTRKKNGKTIKRRTAFFWGEYVNPDGETKREALKLPNGERITDRRVAEAALRELLTRTERKAVGLVDLAIENAATPFRSFVARFAWDLRAKRRTRKHIRLTIQQALLLAKLGGIERLGQLNEPNISRALAVLSGRGVSPKTLREYRGSMGNLCNWGVRVAKLLDRNPVQAIPAAETNGDVRKVRRALTPDQAERLLAVSGPRQLWYMTALFTGLRVSEQLALRWQDMVLDGDRPAVFPQAMTQKARRDDFVPLRPDLAAALQASKPAFARPADRVFKNAPRMETFKRDCAKAGIPYKDDRGRSVDLHALRVTFVSWLSVADVNPRTAQQLARHSRIELTMKNYTDARLLDTVNAVRRLPELHPEQHSQQQKATGTFDHQGVVVPVVSNMRADDGNAVNAEGRDSVSASPCACDSSVCAGIPDASKSHGNACIRLATSGRPTPGITIHRSHPNWVPRAACLPVHWRTSRQWHPNQRSLLGQALNQRKAEGTIPMRVTAPPVFETGAVPLTALPSLG